MSEFVNVKGFPGYVINKEGVVIGPKGTPLTHFPNVDGYPVVYVRLNRKNCCKRVHRFLAEAFIPNPDNLPVVNHKDGDKSNFALDNLEWVTIKENCEHAIKVLKVCRGNSTIDKETATQICEMMQAGKSNKQISEELNISIDIVSKIRCGQSWKNISQHYNIRPRVGRLLIEQIKTICEKLNQGKKIMEIVEEMNSKDVTRDAVSGISSFQTYTQITKDILLHREKRSSTIP